MVLGCIAILLIFLAPFLYAVYIVYSFLSLLFWRLFIKTDEDLRAIMVAQNSIVALIIMILLYNTIMKGV
nr:MAG TPA: hypothetical protein [Caudoviricetes sp.]